MRTLIAIVVLTAATIPSVAQAQSTEADILNGVGGLIGGILDGAAKIEREKNRNRYNPGGYYPGGGGSYYGSAVRAPNGVWLYPGQSTTVHSIGSSTTYYRSHNSWDKRIYSKHSYVGPGGITPAPTPNPGFITPGGGGISISPLPSDPGVLAPNGQRIYSGQSIRVWDGYRWVTYYRCPNPNCRKLHSRYN